MSAPQTTLWLVIPAWRETDRLEAFAARLLPALACCGLHVTLQIVDDGSPASLANALADRCKAWRDVHPFVRPLHRLPENRGKGAAVRAGWDLAVAEDATWLGFCDADGSVYAGEMIRLSHLALAMPVSEPTVLLASRHVPGAYPFWSSPLRRILSRSFAAWVRNRTGLPLRDTQCGAKFLPAALYRECRPRLRIDRFAFDVELLLEAHGAGARFQEEPVWWTHCPNGRLNLARDGWTALREVARLGVSRAP